MNPKPEKHSRLTRIMAKRCEHCLLCKRARAKPETRFGRLMAWHGTWCPFWKAHQEVFAQADAE